MLMCIQNLFRFCQFVHKVLSGNEILTSIKGRNSVKILRKMRGNSPKLDLVNVDVQAKFGQIVSIHSPDTERSQSRTVTPSKFCEKMAGNNPKLDLVNFDVHTKFGQILSIRSQDIERKRNSDVNQGP